MRKRIKQEMHGLYKTSEYRCWGAMIQRCENPNVNEYKWYGGRGIKVCESWRNSFTAFLKDMGKRPSPKHSIDRINTNGNYEPGNCRWATVKEQLANRRPLCNRPYQVVHRDENGKSLVDWARELDIDPTLMVKRVIDQGRTVQEVIDFEKHGINVFYINASGVRVKAFRGKNKKKMKSKKKVLVLSSNH